jgi:acetate kinase
MSLALIINSGSSSLKYQLIELETEQTLASGLIDRIGELSSVVSHNHGVEKHSHEEAVVDHIAALRVVRESFAQWGPDLVSSPPIVIGHRVVHGGSQYYAPTLLTPEVELAIDSLSALAPLHNPANLAGIRASRDIFVGVPQVAVFDTAFHQTLAPDAYTYAIDAELAERYNVRRYGFHGTSHKFVSEEAATFVGRPIGELRMLVLHLGNGASITAIDGGRSVETSMGMTPLEGLVMGTRSGDIDPGVVFHLHRQAGLSFDDIDTLLNRRSGLIGLAGSGDMRDVQNAAALGDEASEAALAVWRHRVRHYIGAYIAQLGGLDLLVFTAGVGENSPLLRRRALSGLEFLGISVDDDLNELQSRDARTISPAGSPVTVLVVPTNEELEIARQSFAVVSAL